MAEVTTVVPKSVGISSARIRPRMLRAHPNLNGLPDRHCACYTYTVIEPVLSGFNEAARQTGRW
jgi:hypothetical protein